jgi:hypothetical protein
MFNVYLNTSPTLKDRQKKYDVSYETSNGGQFLDGVDEEIKLVRKTPQEFLNTYGQGFYKQSQQ